MNSSCTYLTLHDPTPVVAEFRPSVLAVLDPTVNLTVGELIDDSRIVVTFTSLDQLTNTISALRAAANQWVDARYAQRMAAAEQRRAADFGDLIVAGNRAQSEFYATHDRTVEAAS